MSVMPEPVELGIQGLQVHPQISAKKSFEVLHSISDQDKFRRTN